VAPAAVRTQGPQLVLRQFAFLSCYCPERICVFRTKLAELPIGTTRHGDRVLAAAMSDVIFCAALEVEAFDMKRAEPAQTFYSPVLPPADVPFWRSATPIETSSSGPWNRTPLAFSAAITLDRVSV